MIDLTPTIFLMDEEGVLVVITSRISPFNIEGLTQYKKLVYTYIYIYMKYSTYQFICKWVLNQLGYHLLICMYYILNDD